MKLSELIVGEKAIIESVSGSGQFRKRIMEMGFLQGKEIKVIQAAPLKDPIHYKILDYSVSLRLKDAEQITVRKLSPLEKKITEPLPEESDISHNPELLPYNRKHQKKIAKKRIRIALVGNPNCGKTSLFNQASGAHEHVGNYSGVTIEAKTGHIVYNDYLISIVDLPGTYSISAYSPEELYIRKELMGETKPDIVVNVIDTTNIERNLFLTVQLKEMGLHVIAALNMYDEFTQKKEFLDYPKLGKLLGVPMVPTVCRTGLGIEALLDCIVSTWNAIKNNNSTYLDTENGLLRPLKVNYGSILEPKIQKLQKTIQKYLPNVDIAYSRYLSVKLIEGDLEIEKKLVSEYSKGQFFLSSRDFIIRNIKDNFGESDMEAIITDQRYGLISGALKETYRPNKNTRITVTDKIDHILTHRLWGLPIFLLFMFIIFNATFIIGQYPMDWIESLVGLLGTFISNTMSDGPLKDLIVDGIIAGIGGVIVFLPQILILYLFISLMEDSGYMARSAFIMDKLMHTMGLHGKSFISLIMGFGCNVPAIMSTRTIESRKSRLITMLVLPFMSCSARLPVYILFTGALFSSYRGTVLFSLYLIGIIIAVLSARLLESTFFKKEDVPFVMELPPYRRPTAKSLVIHMWNKGKQYLHKMGTVILLASIVIWFLGYFPQNHNLEYQKNIELSSIQHNNNLSEQNKLLEIENINHKYNTLHQKQSYIGKLGRWSEPIIKPLGFNWKMGVSLISGLAAKEVIVSTMGVLYTGDGTNDIGFLKERLITDKKDDGTPSFTPLVAYGFMLFVLIYFPCVATIVAIGRESGKWLWGLFTIIYSCSLAYIVSFVVYQIGSIFIN